MSCIQALKCITCLGRSLLLHSKRNSTVLCIFTLLHLSNLTLQYVCMSQTTQSDKCSLVPLKKALNMHNTCHFEGKLMSFTVGITFKRAQMRMHTVLLCRLLTVSDYTCYLWSPSQQRQKKKVVQC